LKALITALKDDLTLTLTLTGQLIGQGIRYENIIHISQLHFEINFQNLFKTYITHNIYN